MGIPAHIIWRGKNRLVVNFADENYQTYLDWLMEGSQLQGCAIPAYVILTNFVHQLVTPDEMESIGLLIQCVERDYAAYIN